MTGEPTAAGSSSHPGDEINTLTQPAPKRREVRSPCGAREAKLDIFFGLSKLASLVLVPGNLLVILVVVAIALFQFPRTRVWARRTAVAACGLFLGASVLPIGPAMLRMLEQRFPELASCPGPTPGKVAGIVLLGGSVAPGLVGGRTIDRLNDASERVWMAASLARQYPDLPLVVSGGQTFDNGTNRAEADATVALLEQLGVASTQIVRERTSRTTAENAMRSGVMAGEGRWILVTSAFHMPRAVGTFRQAGFDVIPAPTDWRIADREDALTFDAASNLSMTNLATKEYLGLLGYWLAGRSSELFPGPERTACAP